MLPLNILQPPPSNSEAVASAGTDFTIYDGLDQIIISAALVAPRKNVFLDNFEHLLVLATPVEIVILAVGWDESGTEIRLYPTGLSVPSDDIPILAIAGHHSSGRIFLAGKDGSLFELVYKAHDSWFSKKCRKINHSENFLFSSLVPSFFKWVTGGEDPLVDIAIDQSRNFLYTLSESSTIRVYDLGSDGSKLHCVQEARGIWREAAKACPRGHQWDSSMFKIINISPIETVESTGVHLVAIATTGIRLYFTTNRPSYYFQSNTTTSTERRSPNGLYLLHVRLPPAPQLYSAQTATTQSEQIQMQLGTNINTFAFKPQTEREHHQLFPSGIKTCYLRNGFYLLSSPQPSPGPLADRDKLLVIAPDLTIPEGATGPTPSPVFRETLATIDLEGKAWAFAESMQYLSEYEQTIEGLRAVQVSSRHELAFQHKVPCRIFLCLMNTGLHVFEKIRPVARLAAALGASKGSMSEDVATFFEAYGDLESYAMCLQIICMETRPPPVFAEHSFNSSFNTEGITSSPNMHTYATQLLFKSGTNKMKTPHHPSHQDTSTLAPAAYDGFFVYLSRLLRPLWNIPMIKMADRHHPSPQRKRALYLTVSASLFETVQHDCERLLLFLDAHPFLDLAPSESLIGSVSSTTGTHLVQPPNIKQPATAGSITLLLQRTSQLCNLFQIIDATTYFTPALAPIVDTHTQKFLQLTISQAVCEREGQELIGLIITCLLDYITEVENSGGNVNINYSLESFSELLGHNCPHFFNTKDYLKFQGKALLNQCRLTHDPQAIQSLLAASLEVFKQVREKPLGEITKFYLDHHFYSGIIELCQSHVALFDPENYGLLWYTNGSSPSDSHGEKLYSLHLETYSYVMSVFEALFSPDSNSQGNVDQHQKLALLQHAINSDDELFHYALYQWFIDRHLGAFLLDVRSPYIEDFLQSTSVELLWQYYIRIDNYSQAALILCKLSSTKGKEHTLKDRLEKLSRARAFLRDHGSTAGETGDLLHEVQEKLDVGQIQLKIYTTLLRQPPTERITIALTALDNELFSISQLYNQFAQPFELWESALAIIDCSGHHDPKLVEQLWMNLIQQEAGSFDSVVARILLLGKEFIHSPEIFPAAYLINILEQLNYERVYNREIPDSNPDLGSIMGLFSQIGVGYPALFDLYVSLYQTREPAWSPTPKKLHLLHVFLALLREWISFIKSSKSSQYDLRQIEVRNIDSTLTRVINDLGGWTIKEAEELRREYEFLQKSLFKH